MGGPVAPGLPTRFPCWCRAVYSWGGETKRDLGFIEGDLIECLNAGDGSWWMGRLRRDKRMVGLFPSNFVELLDEGSQPASRGPSPMPQVQDGRNDSVSHASSPRPSPTNSRQPSPQPLKASAKSFRKPFAAYTGAGSPNPATPNRGVSPLPFEHARQPSPMVDPQARNGGYRSRGPSPAPSVVHHQTSRGPSPNPYQEAGSSPPPPPPPHRIPYNPAPARSPTPEFDHPGRNGHVTPRPASAAPPSPHAATGHTPSPLRDAMDDVMSSLHVMSFRPASASPQRARSPLNPWSPEAFDQHIPQTARRHARPRTSLGIAGQNDGEEILEDGSYDDHQQAHSSRADDQVPAQVTSYVQRMETRLKTMQPPPSRRPPDELFFTSGDGRTDAPDARPVVPPKNASYDSRPSSSENQGPPASQVAEATTGTRQQQLRNRKSAYELGRAMLGRTFTTKSSATNSSAGVHSNSTNQSTSTQRTSQSIMSGQSAGAFSATSAGSLARKRAGLVAAGVRPKSVMDTGRAGFGGSDGGAGLGRPESPLTGISYHSSHDSRAAGGSAFHGESGASVAESAAVFGGLTAPRPKRSGFFKKIMESAKTGAASARSSIAAGQAASPQVPPKGVLPSGVTGILGGGGGGGNAAKEMGLGGAGSAMDWVQVRRDVNRSNSLSRNERIERQERCQMMEIPVIASVDALLEATQGDEGLDGRPIEEPTNFQAVNLSLVEKNARFINSLPPMTNATSLSQGYVCRPYRSDVQRLRAIFTWVSEKVVWEEDFEGDIDSRRVIQTKRGCAEEVAVLVMEMCAAVGLHAEVVRGYLKVPGEPLELESGPPHPNHWWNAVVVDGAWRVMDCSLASPTNPKRSLYSSGHSGQAETWWFLTRPADACYTHVPELAEQQHLCPPLHHEVLLALPCACPPYFKHGLRMIDFDTSLLRIEELEQVHIHFCVPSDVECVAEVEARAFDTDADGDFFESGELVRKRALAQAEWVGGQKRYTVKALLPGDEGQGTLKVYAGRRGLMHSIKDHPHPLAFALPIVHTGKNPPYEFLTRHPTPHAQRHDLYVAQPQCAQLAVNNTFVFAVRQHPSSLVLTSPDPSNGSTSPIPFARPSSAMSMTSSSASGSAAAAASHSSYSAKKPAKLAIQAPSGKILRLMRKSEHTISTSGPGGGEAGDGGVWETIIKCGERGVWRGLVLADRSARWCVFAEWTCV
ncbi:MAG: cytokinesis protein 3 [Thelocarpon impressellum]|nr:MAG: cytokinesis protein 3 [Thelocarpon impressellum]